MTMDILLRLLDIADSVMTIIVLVWVVVELKNFGNKLLDIILDDWMKEQEKYRE